MSVPDTCSYCSKPSEVKLLRCGNCKIACYCNKECQINAWKGGHKTKCKEMFSDGPVEKRTPNPELFKGMVEVHNPESTKFQVKLKNGKLLDCYSGRNLSVPLSELDGEFSFYIPSDNFLDIKNIPKPMLISTDIKSWLLHIETVRQLIKTLGPGHINAVRREVTKQMANNHRIYTGYTRGLPEAVEAWENLMFDLLVLCVDHHLNKKNIFGLVPNNLDPILASHANG